MVETTHPTEEIMGRFSILIVAGLLMPWGCGTSSPVSAPKPAPLPGIRIPLKDIWAWGMPGTKDVDDLDSEQKPAILKIHNVLTRNPFDLPPDQRDAGPAFALAGTEASVLQDAAAILAGEKKAEEKFSTDDDVWVAFYALQFGSYVHIRDVELAGNVVKVSFVFVAHKTKGISTHFALVPLGKLASGKYSVEIVQMPMDTSDFLMMKKLDKDIDKEAEREYVCKPFSFSVE
jgi:hypothetical protein